jgi:hypothetical protein
MGADFTYSVIDMEIDKNDLIEIVNTASEDTLNAFYSEFDYFLETSYNVSSEDYEDQQEFYNDVRNGLIGTINEAYACENSREVAPLWIDCPETGSTHKYLITGGMSWGDTPTEAYDAFCIVDALQIYFRKEQKKAQNV